MRRLLLLAAAIVLPALLTTGPAHADVTGHPIRVMATTSTVAVTRVPPWCTVTMSTPGGAGEIRRSTVVGESGRVEFTARFRAGRSVTVWISGDGCVPQSGSATVRTPQRHLPRVAGAAGAVAVGPVKQGNDLAWIVIGVLAAAGAVALLVADHRDT